MILQTAMARLEVQDRSILLLRHVQGLSSQEISQIVGLPATTVRSRLARACDTLRSVLPERDLLFDVDTESITLAIVAGEEDR